jgi:hypothetical protein
MAEGGSAISENRLWWEVVGGKFESNPTVHTVYCARAVEPILGSRYIPDPVT